MSPIISLKSHHCFQSHATESKTKTTQITSHTVSQLFAVFHLLELYLNLIIICNLFIYVYHRCIGVCFGWFMFLVYICASHFFPPNPHTHTRTLVDRSTTQQNAYLSSSPKTNIYAPPRPPCRAPLMAPIFHCIRVRACECDRRAGRPDVRSCRTRRRLFSLIATIVPLVLAPARFAPFRYRSDTNEYTVRVRALGPSSSVVSTFSEYNMNSQAKAKAAPVGKRTPCPSRVCLSAWPNLKIYMEKTTIETIYYESTYN